MKIKEGFVLRNVANTYIVVPSVTLDIKKVMTLNESGAFLWSVLTNDVKMEEIVSALVAEYEVDRDIASEDVSLFLESLRNIGALEE